MAEYRAPLALTALVAAVALAPIFRPPADRILVPAKIAPPEPAPDPLGLRIVKDIPGAQLRHASANGQFMTAVDPDARTLTLTRFGRPVWTIALPQDAPPENVLISGDGRRVVLVNYYTPGWNHYTGGNGRDLVILDEDGEILAAYQADDVAMPGLTTPYDSFTRPSLGVVPETLRLDEDQKTATFLRTGVRSHSGSPFAPLWLAPIAIRLSDGAQLALTEEQKADIVAPYLHLMRSRLATATGLDRLEAIWAVAELADTRSLPALTRIIESPDDGTSDSSDLHIQAARSLTQILGPDADRYIRQATNESDHKQNWRDALEAAQSMKYELSLP